MIDLLLLHLERALRHLETRIGDARTLCWRTRVLRREREKPEPDLTGSGGYEA